MPTRKNEHKNDTNQRFYNTAYDVILSWPEPTTKKLTKVHRFSDIKICPVCNKPYNPSTGEHVE